MSKETQNKKISISILGSTGSIGKTAIDLLSNELKDDFSLTGIAFKQNIPQAIQQIKQFKPKFIALHNKDYHNNLKQELQTLSKSPNFSDYKPEILIGKTSADQLASCGESDIIISAISGIEGLSSTSLAVKHAKCVAIANKESIVCGWHIIKEQAKQNNTKIVPIDSEHNSVYRILNGLDASQAKSIMITASGGKFYNQNFADLDHITPEEATQHPNWSMGKKISIDSSTMANKGLELIEACNIFNLEEKKIEVLIQRNSIVHGAVKFHDGSCTTFLSLPNMKLHISHAILACASSLKNLPTKEVSSRNITPLDCEPISFTKLEPISFHEISKDKFPLFFLAKDIASSKTPSHAIEFNALNDLAVELFLNKEISYCNILHFIQKNIGKHQATQLDTIDKIEDYIKEITQTSLRNK